ncbi:MAG: ABC transporter ATP-binding protein [Candidatus Bathyarchaeia archaeon]|nr:ABC transporter ATP-binding protein [Candidatus Bathyarchaeota archaeon]
MSEQYMLRVVKLSRFFGYGFLGRVKFPAVDNVSFDMEYKPKIFTIAGESGCGKSTLARMILGILEPSEGAVIYKGKNIYALKSKERRWFYREVQAIFQDPYDTFNPLKKVDRYLYETARNLLDLKDAGKTQDIVDACLKRVGLSFDEIKGKYPSEFSGGQLQRISIARALIPEPKLIVADEPVSMIDASMRMNILNMFKEFKEAEEISFIYITHDLATAYYISDEIAIMYRGVIVEMGPADEVLIKCHHPYTKALIEALPEPSRRDDWLTRKVKPPGMEVKEFIMPGCKYADICPYREDICEEKKPPMFDVGNVKTACWLYK